MEDDLFSLLLYLIKKMAKAVKVKAQKHETWIFIPEIFITSTFAKITDGELFWKITERRKPMPAFSKKLTPTERWSIVKYVRKLK